MGGRQRDGKRERSGLLTEHGAEGGPLPHDPEIMTSTEIKS